MPKSTAERTRNMQKVLNRTLGLFLVIAMMALCMVPALAAKPMNTGKWYDDGMNAFIDKGYITGYGNGDYGPERNMTRAEFIAVVNKVMGYKDADMNAAAKFKDMDSKKWYYKPIAIALKEGFVKGNGDGTMNPNGTITRQEAVTMLVNIKNVNLKTKTAARKSLEVNESKFKDVSNVANWAVDYVEAAVEDGIITGSKQADGMYLNPKKLLTRAEGVYMIMHLEKEDGVYVLMNIPYAEFYGAQGTDKVDAMTSATAKTGNYGLAGGSYHSKQTAKQAEDGTWQAVGGETGAVVEGITWPVKAASLDDVKALGGKEIKADSKVTVAEAHHGQVGTFDLEGAQALNEAPAYSYYVLKDEPAEYVKLTVNNKKASFSNNVGEVTEVTDAELVITYGGHWGDVVISFPTNEERQAQVPEAMKDKQINGAMITMKNDAQAGMIHLQNIWTGAQFGWFIESIGGLDGSEIASIKYFVNDTKGNYSVISIVPEALSIAPVYDGEVTAAFSKDVKSVEVTGLPKDIKNPTAMVSYSARGQAPVYLTKTEVDPKDGDNDPVPVAVKDGKIELSAAPDSAVQNYTVVISSENYAPISATAANPNYVKPESGGNGSGNGGGNGGGNGNGGGRG